MTPACCRQVELIESHCRVRQMLLNPFDVSRRHVDADRLNLLRVAAMRAQVCRQTLNGGHFPSLSHKEHRAALCVSGNRHILVSLSLGGFVDGQFVDFREICLRQRQLNVALGNRCYPACLLQAGPGTGTAPGPQTTA